MPGGERKQLGQQGEQLAAEFLKSKGLREVGRNISVRIGEIDLLMEAGDTLVLVEVKTHAKRGLIDPVYKIGPAKQRKLWQLAQLVAARHPGRNVRIDAVTLYWSPEPRLRHYENVITL